MPTAVFAREKHFHDLLRSKRTFQDFLLRRAFVGWSTLIHQSRPVTHTVALIRAPFVLYGVKYIDLVSLEQVSRKC